LIFSLENSVLALTGELASLRERAIFHKKEVEEQTCAPRSHDDPRSQRMTARGHGSRTPSTCAASN